MLLADYIGLKLDLDWIEARGDVQSDHEGSTLTAPSLRYQMASVKHATCRAHASPTKAGL